MHIAFISPKIGSAFGQERATKTSISLLESKGHKTTLIEAGDLAGLHSLSNPWKAKKATDHFIKNLQKTIPDIVHFVEQFDFRVMREVAKRYPTVLTAHTVAPTCPASHRMTKQGDPCKEKSGLVCLLYHYKYGCLKHFKNDLHRLNAVQNYLFKREAMKNFSAIFAISSYVEKTLVTDEYDISKIFKVYNAVEVKEGPLLSNAPKKLIVTASRLVELKGIEYTLRALKLIEKEDWTFWILGDGPDRKKLEKLAGELGLSSRVEFKGYLPSTETEKAIRSSLFLTQTNIGPEGFGLTVAEAQAMGKPVIAFDMPALDEIIVNGETGYLVKRFDIEALSLRIKELLQDSAMRLYFSSQAREQTSFKFSSKNHLEATLKGYDFCLKGSASVKCKDPKSASISLT